MDLPFKVRLPIKLQEINDFCIVHFQDKKLPYPDLHWYVLIPAISLHFIVVIITSQGQKRADYYRGTPQVEKAVNSLVKINNDEFSFLSKDSVIECNQAEYLDIQEIVHRTEEDKDFKIEQEKIPGYLKKEIVSAINNSPLVPPFIKKLAIAANPL